MERGIVFIGAGNVATHLATELHRCGFPIMQIYSRTIASASALASRVEAQPITHIVDVTDQAGLYIFSVKDDVLEDLIEALPPNNGVWVHTAGSMPLDLFEASADRYGVLYPFQTFTKGIPVEWEKVPVYIEASDKETLEILNNVCCRMSDNVKEMPSESRKFVHLAGVFACNFSNFMFSLSESIIERAGLTKEDLLPLINQTCKKIHRLTPHEAQTGPAIRFDENVMDKHMLMLQDENLRSVYELLSKGIYELHNSKENEYDKL